MNGLNNHSYLKEIKEFAKIDCYRHKRVGKPEVVFAESKDAKEVVEIVKGYLRHVNSVLITRLKSEQIDELKKSFDEVYVNSKARIAIVGKLKDEKIGKVAILTAGTSDIPVGEEAAVTAEFLGLEVLKFYDVGIAGLHRLIEPIKRIRDENVDVVIAIAGMEGALPSVVASLIDLPIIAVPTSVGYGVNLKGISTLFAMLQSCSSGVAVVNIDNGFGAAVFAYLIVRRIKKRLEEAKNHCKF